MRIRTVKPEFHQSETLGKVSREVRYLACALLNWADDEGYFVTNPRVIAGSLLPLDDDGPAFVERALPELERIGYLVLFEGHVGLIPGLPTHQRINRPTKSKLKAKALKPLSLTEDSVSPHTHLSEASPTEGKGREGNKEDSSSSTLSLAATPPPEEEESTYDDALRILVRYRYTHRGTDQPPIVNLLAWEATTKANENATHGNEIRQRLTQGTDAASAVAGVIDPAEARRIARDLGLRVEFDERPLPDPDCVDCAGSGWRTVEEGSTRVEPCSCMASNVTPLRRTS